MDIPAKDYFLSRRPEAGEECKMYNRIITALARRDLTMQALCKMSEKELKMVRGVGPSSFNLIKSECENYRKANSFIGGEVKKKNLTFRRILAILLTLCLTFSLLPVNAFAVAVAKDLDCHWSIVMQLFEKLKKHLLKWAIN